jgi:hypothetical protein
MIFLCKPVGEVFLLFVVAHVHERQDGDRRSVRQCIGHFWGSAFSTVLEATGGGASELREEVIACRINHPATMLGDDVFHHSLEGIESADGPLLVLAHEAAVAFDICA